MLNHVEGTSYTDSIATQATFWSGKLLGNKAYGPIGAKPARASTFISVYKTVYTIGHRSHGGLRDARKGVGVRQVSVLKTT